MWTMHFIRGEFRTAFELAEELLRRAQTAQDQTLLLLAHFALGDSSLNMGKLPLAREHLEAVISLYHLERDRPLALRFGVDPKANCLGYSGLTLWLLGYPDQALQRGNEALAFSEALSHPNSLAGIECFA